MNRNILLTLLLVWIVSAAYAQDPLDAAKKKIEKKDFAGAKADISKILAANPKNKQAFVLSGQARWGLEDFYGAIGDYTYALEIDSTLAEAWNDQDGSPQTLPAHGMPYATQNV